MPVTPMDALVQAAAPEEIVISGFKPGSEITVLVHKPNFYSMLARGAIPNPLVPELEKLFVRNDRSGYNKGGADFAQALIFMARECLQQPSYEELESNGIELTDDQLAEISLYATAGAEALRTFRAKIRDANRKHGAPVSAPAQ